MLRPTCPDCGNDDEFVYKVSGEATIDDDNNSLDMVQADVTYQLVRCADCESMAVLDNYLEGETGP